MLRVRDRAGLIDPSGIATFSEIAAAGIASRSTLTLWMHDGSLLTRKDGKKRWVRVEHVLEVKAQKQKDRKKK